MEKDGWLTKIIEQGKVYAVIPILGILAIWDLAKAGVISYLAAGAVVGIVLIFLIFRLVVNIKTGNDGGKLTTAEFVPHIRSQNPADAYKDVLPPEEEK